jgi:hypothetical protein
MIRDKVIEDSTLASNLSYNITALAWKHRTIKNRSGVELPDNFAEEYHPLDPGKLSILNLPPGADVDVEETQAFDAPVFAYMDRVKADLNMEYPAALRGIATGTSGRQEDILGGAGLALYDCAIQAVGNLWAEAIEKAFQICYRMPDMIPKGLKQDDINSYSEIWVDVAEGSPLDRLRRAADGDRKYKMGIIDLETNLVQYQGFTQEEADRIMTKLLVDDVTRNHPVIRQLMGMQLARELGIEQEFAELSQQGAVPRSGLNPEVNYGSRGGQPREANIRSLLGMEQPDLSQERRPVRQPPEE